MTARGKSLYGKPLPATLPAAHRRISELEHALHSALRLLPPHKTALDATASLRERLRAMQEILQQESLDP